jgi:FlaA1/EpsC-like NDP-sugar epimerase
VDDDSEKQGQEIHGVSIAGTLPDLSSVVEKFSAQEVVIAIPTAPGAVVRLVTDICRRHQIPFRTMPGMYELIGGKVSVKRLREVDIADLLRREPAQINDEQIGEMITGKRVLVTGAGGSIGMELCRQTARWRPAQLALLGHGENSIFEALLDLTEDFPGLPIMPIIADVRDRERMFGVFDDFRPEFIFHAAAHKHVPLMEVNVEEAVTNNVIGTKNTVDAALFYDTERFVLVSTDKAVEPRSVYGATKRMAEIIVRDAANRSGRPYVAVRFGNVLGSRGSIVPIFKRQISRGGPVTVTDPEMKRFFMTIPEAVHLVLQSSAMGRGGELYILGMGEQVVRILDLAEDLIRLSGLEPGKDIEIVFTGIRAGEKLSEALWDDGMNFEATEHPDILRVEEALPFEGDQLQATIGELMRPDILRVEEALPFEGDQLQATIGELMRLALEGDAQALVGLLSEKVPGSLIRQTPPPDYTSVL